MNDQELMLYALSHGWTVKAVGLGWRWFDPLGACYLVEIPEHDGIDLPVLNATVKYTMLRRFGLRRPVKEDPDEDLQAQDRCHLRSGDP